MDPYKFRRAVAAEAFDTLEGVTLTDDQIMEVCADQSIQAGYCLDAPELLTDMQFRP